MNKKLDFILGMLFAVATLVFIVVFMTNDVFFNWAFERHHNVLSWYIRPLLIIPLVIFAFKKSFTGVFASIFALFTSMFWFPAPATSSSQVLQFPESEMELIAVDVDIQTQVLQFLEFEMEYLKGTWDAPKILMTLAVPLFFVMLIAAAWKRNWKWLVGVIVGAAALKFIWSVAFSGEAGMSILAPALVGLVACVGGLYYFFRRHKRTSKPSKKRKK